MRFSNSSCFLISSFTASTVAFWERVKNVSLQHALQPPRLRSVSSAYNDGQKSLEKVYPFGAFFTDIRQTNSREQIQLYLPTPPAPHSIVLVGEGKRDTQRRIFERRAVPFQATVALQLIRCITASQGRFFTIVANMPSRAVSSVYYEYTQYLVVLTPLSSFDRNNSCWPRMASHCFESRMNN